MGELRGGTGRYREVRRSKSRSLQTIIPHPLSPIPYLEIEYLQLSLITISSDRDDRINRSVCAYKCLGLVRHSLVYGSTCLLLATCYNTIATIA